MSALLLNVRQPLIQATSMWPEDSAYKNILHVGALCFACDYDDVAPNQELRDLPALFQSAPVCTKSV